MSGTITIAAGAQDYETGSGTYTDTLTVGAGSTLNAYSTTTTANNLTITDLTGSGYSFTINAGYYANLVFDASEALTGTVAFNIGLENQPGATGVTTGFGTFTIGADTAQLSTNTTIGMYGTSDTLVVDNATSAAYLGAQVAGFATTDAIDLDAIGYADGDYAFWSQTKAGGGTLEVLDSDDNLLSTIAFSGGTYKTTKFVIGSDAAGGVQITYLCFLSGTLIATPAGQTCVEALRPGDLVTTIVAGVAVPMPIIWVGSRRIDAASVQDPGTVYPVRIRAGAFGEGVPSRDLLVTQEHCIFIDGCLTPARMLVNGRSITIDDTITAFEFFHIELPQHGIVVSEDLMTESYFDSGNRALMLDGAAEECSGQPMAAPLAVARADVEPIWHRLDQRASVLGYRPRRETVLTDEPDLRVLLDDGRTIPPCWHDAAKQMFRIPHGTRPIRLISRASTPADVIGPFCDDRRRLGVKVEKLVLWDGLNDAEFPAVDFNLPGWHAGEDQARWTDGAATLHLPDMADGSILDVHLVATMVHAAASAGGAA